MKALTQWRQLDLKVHQLAAPGIAQPIGVKMRPARGIWQVGDVEEEKAIDGGVRLHGAGLEDGTLQFVEFGFWHEAVRLIASRHGNRRGDVVLRTGVRSADGGEDARQIIERIRRGLGAVSSDELKTQMVKRDGVIAFIGEDHQHGQHVVLQQLGVEDGGLFRRVVALGTQAKMLVRIHKVRRHLRSRAQWRHGEIAGQGQAGEHEYQQGGHQQKVIQPGCLGRALHAQDYRPGPFPPHSSTMADVYFFYSFVLTLGLIVTLPWWLLQMLRLGKYRAGLWERLGMVPARLRRPSNSPDAALSVAWIHAVSVGEALAVAPLVDELRTRGWRVVVSTTTHTGQRLARQKFGEENVFYFPLDLPFCIRPYLRLLRPRLVAMAETELWPNFLRMARESGAHVAVVNARISDRSLPRYRRFRGLLEKVMAPVELFLAQSDLDADRLRQIGAVPARVECLGNLKFDAAPPAENPAVVQLGAQLHKTGAPVIVAGSTVDGEEEYILKAFRMVLLEHPSATLVLAPRHRERFKEVAEILHERRAQFVRRSEAASADADLKGKVLLLDTLGELAAIYCYADLAFVGGSLVPKGGHNILEPAYFSKPILTGEYTENFRDIVHCFEEARAVVRCTPKNLGLTFLLLLREKHEREGLGERAHQVLERQRGASLRTAERLLRMLEEA